jgi:hypothetical protein
MSSLRALRGRLFAAIGLTAACVLAPPGCKGSMSLSRSLSCGSPPYPLPSCPSGAFCATVADIARAERDRELDAAASMPATDAASKPLADAGRDSAPPAQRTDAAVGPPPPPEMAPAPYGDCPAHTPDPTWPASMSWNMTTFDPATTATERAKTPTQCCYTWYQPCPGGRPLIVADEEVVAGDVARDDWLADVGATDVARAGAGARWLREAASEHASIASFARASLQLLALGAPPELVAGVHAAAIDEIAHARVCYALASRALGEARGPGALAACAPIDASPEVVARETFVGGCVNETIAAIEIAAARDAMADGATRAAIGAIAEDEAHHAELAWRTLAWLVLAHPSCASALGDAVGALEDELRTLPDDRAGSLRASALRTIVLPCARGLLGVTPPRAAARRARASRRTPPSTRST